MANTEFILKCTARADKAFKREADAMREALRLDSLCPRVYIQTTHTQERPKWVQCPQCHGEAVIPRREAETVWRKGREGHKTAWSDDQVACKENCHCGSGRGGCTVPQGSPCQWGKAK